MELEKENKKKEWFVVNTVSGHEYKVKEKLEMRIETMGLQDRIFRVIVPEQKEIEYKDGVKKEKVKKMFPGYVLIEMIMNDDDWFIVRNTQVLLVSLDRLVRVLNQYHYYHKKLIRYSVIWV